MYSKLSPSSSILPSLAQEMGIVPLLIAETDNDDIPGTVSSLPT